MVTGNWLSKARPGALEQLGVPKKASETSCATHCRFVCPQVERRLAKVRKFVAPWAVYRADHDAVLPFHWACSIDGPLDRAQQSLNLSLSPSRLSPGPLTSPLAGDDEVKFLKRSASAGALQVRVWALQELCIMCQSNCPLHATLYSAGPCPLRVKEDARGANCNFVHMHVWPSANYTLSVATV